MGGESNVRAYLCGFYFKSAHPSIFYYTHLYILSILPILFSHPFTQYKGIPMTEDINRSERIEEVRKQYSCLPEAMKPCVALLLQAGCPNNGGRNDTAYLIATELRRTGKKPEVAERILLRWNHINGANPLPTREITSVLKSAYRTNYTYGCNNVKLREICIGKEKCPFYQQLKKRNQGRYREADFYKFSWQNILTPSQICIYHGLTQLERIRNIKPGQLIVANQRQIAKISGVSRGSVSPGLSKMTELGLINYKPGEPFKWKIKASEIRRVVPIPYPE